jgi:hypothetical protein
VVCTGQRDRIGRILWLFGYTPVQTAAELDFLANKYTPSVANVVASQAVGLKLETWEGLMALGPGVRSLRALHRALQAEGECLRLCGRFVLCPRGRAQLSHP